MPGGCVKWERKQIIKNINMLIRFVCVWERVWEVRERYLIVRKPQSCQVLQLSEGEW